MAKSSRVALMGKCEVQLKVVQTRHLKKGDYEVQQKVGRPGTLQKWHLKNREYEIQLKVGRPGTPQTWHLKNRGLWKLTDQVFPTPDTSNFTECGFYIPIRHTTITTYMKCIEIWLHVYSH